MPILHARQMRDDDIGDRATDFPDGDKLSETTFKTLIRAARARNLSKQKTPRS